MAADRRPDWAWFEIVLAYDNARLPQALIRAGVALDRPELVRCGLETLDWIVGKQTGPDGRFRAVGTESFGRVYQDPLPFDQQPLEAQATIDACVAAWEATGDRRWVAEAEIPPLLATAGALVLPYREASQSGVVSLAHAVGVPVVATPVGGLAEQVTDGVDGAVAAAAAAPAALAEAMARLCDPAERDRLAAGARRTGRALADWDAQAAALLDALRGFGIGAEHAGPRAT